MVAVVEERRPEEDCGMCSPHRRKRSRATEGSADLCLPSLPPILACFCQRAYNNPWMRAVSVKVLVRIGTFTRFARAGPIPDERAERVARRILHDRVLIFVEMETLLSDRDPTFIGKLVSNMAEKLGTRRITTSPFHSQAKGCVGGGTGRSCKI